MTRRGLNANLPVAWLSDPLLNSLSADAWRLHTRALMWCVSQDVDGLVTNAALAEVGGTALRGARLAKAADELIDAGVWVTHPLGVHVADWEGSQTTAEARGARRRSNARAQADWRERQQRESERIAAELESEREWRSLLAEGTERRDF